MAKFTTCIRGKRNDGLYPVYIRVFHNGGLQYINTGLLVNEHGIKTSYTKSGKKQTDISDRIVLKKCMDTISKYAEKINRMDADGIDSKRLVDMLTEKNAHLSFTEYAKEYIRVIQKKNSERTVEMYNLSVKKLHEFLDKENILFNDLTSRVIRGWIDSMKDSARKKSAYPSYIRAIFNAAILKYNDPEMDIVRIRFNPFDRVKIPAQEMSEKRSVEADIINNVLTAEITFPKSNEKISREELARDAAMMIFCLAGINAADLYDLKTDALKEWKLCYHRKKTRKKSKTGAYMEISVPETIKPLFEKYKGKDEMLFVFSERFVDRAGFVKNVNKGLKWICEELEFLEMSEDDPRRKKKEKKDSTETTKAVETPKPTPTVEKKKEYILKKPLTTYTFRHSWATIAQNNCGASTEMVAFALNHASVHKITEGYIRKDYTPIDDLNKKVIEFVFGETKKADT